MGIGMAGVGLAGTAIPGVGETGGPEAYAATGVALAAFSDGVGTGADLVSLAAKGIDYEAFGGSKQALIDQGKRVFVDFTVGKLIDAFVPESAAKSVAVKTGKEAAQTVTKSIFKKQLSIQQ